MSESLMSLLMLMKALKERTNAQLCLLTKPALNNEICGGSNH